MQVVIVGGGMVGAAAAVALAQQGHQIELIEAGPVVVSSGPWDLRISSIHLRNVQWLQQLQTWAQIRPERQYSYTQLAVQTQHGQRLEFNQHDSDTEMLGAMVENHALQQALWQQFAELPINARAQTQVQAFDLTKQQVQLSSGELLSYDLLIGADGAQSQVAKAAQIGQRGWDYDMRCMLALAELAEPIAPATWEVFRPEGPYALLPLGERQACLIDYRSEQQWQRFSQQPEAVAQQLEQTFAPHLGAYQLLNFASFPLRRQRALRYQVKQSVVLIGDAAHSIHPLAGQGVNLGFADVQTLVAQLASQPLAPALAAYERIRMRENQLMMRAMDAIHVGFSSPHWAPQGLVAAGLFAVAQVQSLKRALVRRAIGF